MKNFLIALLVFSSCRSSVYVVVNEESFSGEDDKANLKKLILIHDQKFQNGHYLTELINKHKWDQLQKLQPTIPERTNDFLHAIKLLIDKQFAASYQVLNTLPDTAFNCEVLILKTDCLKELNAPAIDYHARYQQASDCTSNDKIKSIANKRYRFITYGY